MGSVGPLHELTIQQAGRLLRGGQLSRVELTEACLRRIERLDGTLHTFITLLPEAALAAAREAEGELRRGEDRGPLHGIPLALKDLIDTAGVRTTAGSRLYVDRVPGEDATATARLKAAGAVLLGKLSMHALAIGGDDAGGPFPAVRNPWNLDHVPGGSSSGSAAAVAACLLPGSLGSCTGGSIRGPAAYCGVVGLKPTYGLVSRYGVLPAAWSLDHCGPLARTVGDVALLLQAIDGHDPRDPTTSRAPVPDYAAALREDVRGLRIGLERRFFFPSDPRVSPETLATVEAALEALERLGARLVEVSLPLLEHADSIYDTVMQAEAFAFHEPSLRARPDEFDSIQRARLQLGAITSAADYLQAQRLRSALRRQFAEVLGTVDLLATPTMPTPAPRVGQVNVLSPARPPSFTRAFNLTGLPAISIPCGFSSTVLPIGLQLAGRPFDEPTVLRAAHTFERQAGLAERRPRCIATEEQP